MYAHLCAGIYRGYKKTLKIPLSWSIGSYKLPDVGAGDRSLVLTPSSVQKRVEKEYHILDQTLLRWQGWH